MQIIGTFNRKRLVIFITVPVILVAALIGLDQISKYFAARDEVDTAVIDGFFYLTYSTNRGAGFSFLADKDWGQLLFKIITPFALIAFFAFYVFAMKKSYKWLTYSLALIIAGTVGNYIDRLINSEVVDFLSFRFGNYFFPTFNVADMCLTVGVIMLIIHFLFLDNAAVFKKKSTPSDGDGKDDENA
ncbi:MAG: signal peptidase II [Clostridia bacterium]|nr:signal peptidase II [Clostridia bacterium]